MLIIFRLLFVERMAAVRTVLLDKFSTFTNPCTFLANSINNILNLPSSQETCSNVEPVPTAKITPEVHNFHLRSFHDDMARHEILLKLINPPKTLLALLQKQRDYPVNEKGFVHSLQLLESMDMAKQDIDDIESLQSISDMEKLSDEDIDLQKQSTQSIH